MAYLRQLTRREHAPNCPACGEKMWLWAGTKCVTIDGTTARYIQSEHYSCDEHSDLKIQTPEQLQTDLDQIQKLKNGSIQG